MSIEAMKQALEALKIAAEGGGVNFYAYAEDLRQAIEQAERQETNQVTLTQTNVGIGERGMEAYEAAKKRSWVGVSDERLMEMPKQQWVGLTQDELLHIGVATGLERAAAYMIEAKLKEKNT